MSRLVAKDVGRGLEPLVADPERDEKEDDGDGDGSRHIASPQAVRRPEPANGPVGLLAHAAGAPGFPCRSIRDTLVRLAMALVR